MKKKILLFTILTTLIFTGCSQKRYDSNAEYCNNYEAKKNYYAESPANFWGSQDDNFLDYIKPLIKHLNITPELMLSINKKNKVKDYEVTYLINKRIIKKSRCWKSRLPIIKNLKKTGKHRITEVSDSSLKMSKYNTKAKITLISNNTNEKIIFYTDTWRGPAKIDLKPEVLKFERYPGNNFKVEVSITRKGETATSVITAKNHLTLRSKESWYYYSLKDEHKTKPEKEQQKLYMAEVTKNIKLAKPKMALIYFELVDELSIKPHSSFYYFYGQNLIDNDMKNKAIEQLERYVLENGVRAKYYKKSINLLKSLR